MKKHSWEMMLFYPLGLGCIIYYGINSLMAVQNKEVASMLSMYIAGQLSFWLVSYYNKRKKWKKKE
jgi:hypothetical protein